VRGPHLAVNGQPQLQGCTVRRPPAPSIWRLTDRGIALIIATGLAIATAALVVVGLTAWRVTSDTYAPLGQVQNVSR
jgi:hypothetical protein